MFGCQIVNFPLSDAMLSRARALRGKGPLDQAIEKFLDPGTFRRIGRIDQGQHMEISIAYMAHNRGQQP